MNRQRMQSLTRRSGLATGAKVAFAAPAIIAGLRGGTALAHSGSGSHSGSISDPDTKPGSPRISNDSTTSGERDGLQLLGRARLCERIDADEHKNAGKVRLFTDANGVNYLFLRIRGAGTRSVMIVKSPNAVLSGTLQLTDDRAVITPLSADQVSKLLVANTKDFQGDFHFQYTEGNQVFNFVTCPDQG